MPARELLALAARWRDHPTGAAQDGELLAATRSALASLDGRERAALGQELRTRGADQLAERLEVSDRLPVWSDEFTGVARDLLSLDPATLGDLVQVADPDAVSTLEPPVGPPVDLPPPSSPDPSLPASPAAAAAAAEEGDTLASDLPDVPEVSDAGDAHDGVLATGQLTEPLPQATDLDASPAPAAPSSVPTTPAWEARRWAPRDPAGSPARAPVPVRTDAAGGAVARTRRGEAAAPSLAPGVRSSLVARTRFLQLDERIAAGLTPAVAHELIAEAPDGWQRRRIILRLLDAELDDLDATAVLGSLARAADRTIVADRLVRHGAATVAEVTPHLRTGAAARLRRRHGRP